MKSTIIAIPCVFVAIITSSFLLLATQGKKAVYMVQRSGHKHVKPVPSLKKETNYIVKRLKQPMKIDGNWNKREWRRTKPINISNFMGQIPSFRPIVQAKMLYDDKNLYVIFRVHDRYVHSVVEDYNGPVSGDACVEFFFSPDTAFRQQYFNLEINAGGTPLMAYHIFSRKDNPKFSAEELNQIEIAHSLPRKIDPEIVQPVTWTLEYRLPIAILEKYCSVVRPEPSTVWRANFYKTSSKSSNPHWITWSKVEGLTPNFHLPQFFGIIQFQ